jgi:hypothetical protein
MRTPIVLAIVCAALVSVALAQVAPTSSSVYLLDVDPARYAGPPIQRIVLRVGDQPRHFLISAQDEICVQLLRDVGTNVISARVRALRPEPQNATAVRIVAPDISPGTFRSTPWGMLLRAMPEDAGNSGQVKALASDGAPACTL